MKTLWGILGGMGGFAGLRLARFAMEEAVRLGAKADSDFPNFVLYNLPARGMDETGATDTDAFICDIIDGLCTLTEARCRYAVIACNTAHQWWDAFKDIMKEDDALINMVDVALDACKTFKKVGILCSRTARASRLYEDECLQRGLESVITTPDEQRLVDAAIKAAMFGKGNYDHEQRLEEIVSRMAGEGVERIIVGCTELPLVLHTAPTIFIDPGEEAVKRALSLTA